MNVADSAQLRSVLYPVADVVAAVKFYQRGLGLPPGMLDGTRYAVLPAGASGLALAGPTEQLCSTPAASFRVADIAQTVRQLQDAGGTVVHGPEAGPHETRVAVSDPFGNVLVVYAPK